MKALAIAAAIIVVVGVAAFAWRQSHNSGHKVNVDKVADSAKRHRATNGSGGDRGQRPAAGTYVYRGSGKDHVSTLRGSTHVFGAKIPAVAELKTGCQWTLTFTYVKEKTLENRLCTTDTGVRERGSTEIVSFFGLTEKQKFVCDSDGWRVKFNVKPGTSWKYTCHTGDRTVKHNVTLVEVVPATVGGKPVAKVWHTYDAAVLSGASVGPDTSDFWWTKEGLPIRFTDTTKIRTKSIIGDTDYDVFEKYELVSLTPR